MHKARTRTDQKCAGHDHAAAGVFLCFRIAEGAVPKAFWKFREKWEGDV
jgi:hypothetical protein